MSRFASFREFYPFYLGEHRNRTCGACISSAAAACSRWSRSRSWRGNAWWLLGALFCGYGFAWVGHFFFEKNRPATFKHPFYSFARRLGDVQGHPDRQGSKF